MSSAGTVYRAEILREAAGAFAEVGELTFDASEPITIEWDSKGKEEPICGSTATLNVISPGDRTYAGLYTVEAGSVRLDIYRNGFLYWSGCIDTEFYEEPYERQSGYIVSLSFTDLGIFKRLKLYGHGARSLAGMLREALDAAGLENLAIDDSLISSRLAAADAETMSLSDILVSGDNFYDEDGEAVTAEEMIAGILQPLALRAIQRSGKLWVYDINGLMGAERSYIEWKGATQTLSADKVYNNVTVTWSPYVRKGNLLPEECWTLKTDKTLYSFSFEDVNAGGRPVIVDGKAARYTSYHYTTDSDEWPDQTDVGFTLWLSRTGKGAELVSDKINYYKIVPQNDGSESEGIAIMYTAVWADKVDGAKYMSFNACGVLPPVLSADISAGAEVLFRSQKADIPAVANPDSLYLRVVARLLLDPRSNPFEQAGDWMDGAHEKTYQEQWSKYGNFVYVPCCVKFQSARSGKIYCWDNRLEVKTQAGLTLKSLDSTLGQWKEYTETGGKPDVFGYLAYYSGSDRRDAAGVANGFANNRPGINPHRRTITTQLSACEPGAYLPYPDDGAGNVWVEILSPGWEAIDAGHDFTDTRTEYFFKDYQTAGHYKIRHILMELPQIEIVNARMFGEDIDDEDIVYRAELNASAAEPLEIDTICGSVAGGVPTARGVYLRSDGSQITELTRAGRTAQIEELLIGTLYSQYAERHTVLSGEAAVPPDGLCVFIDRAQEGTCLFMQTGGCENLGQDTSDAEFIEITPDEYVRAEVETE